MIRVYQAHSAIVPTPLTIFATDVAQAARTFQTWAEHHRPKAKAPPAEFRASTLTELALQPQLAVAAGTLASGIGYWLGHRAGWVIAAPHESPKGALSPLDTNVRCYSIIDGDGEHLVFAENIEAATAHFTHWSLLADGEVDEQFSVHQMSPWLLLGPMVTLREDMDAGLVGIGLVSVDGFWHIYPADYEPTYD